MKLVLALALFFALPLAAQSPAAAGSSPKGVLSAETAQHLIPPAVFFSGQTATVQVRNSAAVRFTNNGLFLAALVDTGGYSTSVREKYQFYLLADAAFEVGGKRFAPGSYGAGFVGGSLIVMDLGANDLLHVPSARDAAQQRPRPLQIVDGTKPGEFRLYVGREYVAFQQAR